MQEIGQVSLQSICQQILDLQTHWESENTPEMRERGNLIRTEGPKWLRDLIGTNFFPGIELRVEGRDGAGRKSKVPWIRIYSEKHSPSATEGWYVVFLYAADGSAVFLSLNQGTM